MKKFLALFVILLILPIVSAKTYIIEHHDETDALAKLRQERSGYDQQYLQDQLDDLQDKFNEEITGRDRWRRYYEESSNFGNRCSSRYKRYFDNDEWWRYSRNCDKDDFWDDYEDWRDDWFDDDRCYGYGCNTGDRTMWCKATTDHHVDYYRCMYWWMDEEDFADWYYHDTSRDPTDPRDREFFGETPWSTGAYDSWKDRCEGQLARYGWMDTWCRNRVEFWT